MGTKTVSLSDDAYERLAAEKREGESFSDVVRRLTQGVDLKEFHGVLSDETADEIEESIERSRRRNEERRADRKNRIWNDS
ncbi:MAG: antitoxin VapB family protein [Halobacteriales archaeon]